MPSSERTPVVLEFVASEPASGSVKPNAAIFSPEHIPGNHFCFCSSLPYQIIPKEPIEVCTFHTVQKDALPQKDIPSASIHIPVFVISEPPYFSGTSIPKNPNSPICSTSFLINFSSFLFNSFCDNGKSSFVAKSRIAS